MRPTKIFGVAALLAGSSLAVTTSDGQTAVNPPPQTTVSSTTSEVLSAIAKRTAAPDSPEATDCEKNAERLRVARANSRPRRRDTKVHLAKKRDDSIPTEVAPIIPNVASIIGLKERDDSIPTTMLTVVTSLPGTSSRQPAEKRADETSQTSIVDSQPSTTSSTSTTVIITGLPKRAAAPQVEISTVSTVNVQSQAATVVAPTSSTSTTTSPAQAKRTVAA